jgi:hypothetical protein
LTFRSIGVIIFGSSFYHVIPRRVTMSVMITLVLDENNHALYKKLAAFVDQHCAEIQILKIENTPSACSGEVMIILNDSDRLNALTMNARIIGAARTIDHPLINETAGRVGIIGTGLCLNNTSVFKHIIERLGDDKICSKPIIQFNEPSNFRNVKKIPIPAQCKKAKNITKKH